MKLILLGYMASGKSTIGKLLSAKLTMPFIDLDAYIEAQEKKTITTIFKEKGEIYFRNKEHQYLKELLNSNTNFVLSLGGGTPCYAGNMEVILQSKATSIYLKTSLQTLVKRLQLQKNKRPLVANLTNSKLTEFVAKHLFERAPFYEKATIKITCNTQTTEQLATQITNLISLR